MKNFGGRSGGWLLYIGYRQETLGIKELNRAFTI